MVCVGFVVTEVGVAVIVRVQSAELSSVQRFVLRLIGDWGTGSERIGGIALLGCPLPRPRRRSTTVIDLLIWTPYGCTLVVLADFGSVQHGLLETPPGGRWQVGERAADLRTVSGAVNPLLRARRQRAELAAIFRRHGVPEQIDVLVVLIPKTGSRITWTRPPQEAGEETIMVRIGQSADFTEYFEHSPGRAACWRAADIARVFGAFGVPLSAPDPAESAAEGFEVTGDDTMIGAPAAADRLRKTAFPLFGAARRRATPLYAPELPGRVVHGPAEQEEQVDTGVDMGPAGVDDERAVPDAAAADDADRERASGDGADAPPGASGTRPQVTSAPWQGHSNTAVSELDMPGTADFDGSETNTDAERNDGPQPPAVDVRAGSREQPENTGETDSDQLRRKQSDPQRRTHAPSVAEGGLREQQEARPHSGAADFLAGPDPDEHGRRLRSAERSADHTPETSRPAAADFRSGRLTGVVRKRVPAPTGEEAPPASAENARADGGVAVPAITAGGPVGQHEPRSAERGSGKSVRIPVGVRRGLSVFRRAPAEVRDRASVVRPAGGPRGREHARPAGSLRVPERGRSAARSRASEYTVPEEVAGQPAESTAAGGRGARYAAAVGAAGAVLAVVAGTVFAASGFARFEVAEYGALCHGGSGTTVAAPYAVAGPSPVHLAGELSEITTFGPSAVWHPADARSVQLVACVSEGRLGALVRTCQYPPAPGHPVGRTLNLFAMAYRLSVYEARTGNRLAAIDLTGEQFAADPAVTEADACRAAAGAPEEGLPGRRHSRLSHRQVQQALAPFVTPATSHIRAAR